MANMIMFSICRYQLSNDDGNKGQQETNSQKVIAFILSMGELHWGNGDDDNDKQQTNHQHEITNKHLFL